MLNINASLANIPSIGLFMFKSAIWGLLSCTSLLFLPQSFLASLFLNEWVVQNNQFIGLVLITSTVYAICYLLNIILNESLDYLLARRKIKSMKSKIKSLDLAERALLREFLLQGVSVLNLPQHQDVVKHLDEINIIERVSNEHNAGIASYKISSLARKHLNKQALGLPIGQLTTRDIQRLKNTRPKYVQYLKRPREHAA